MIERERGMHYEVLSCRLKLETEGESQQREWRPQLGARHWARNDGSHVYRIQLSSRAFCWRPQVGKISDLTIVRKSADFFKRLACKVHSTGTFDGIWWIQWPGKLGMQINWTQILSIHPQKKMAFDGTILGNIARNLSFTGFCVSRMWFMQLPCMFPEYPTTLHRRRKRHTRLIWQKDENFEYFPCYGTMDSESKHDAWGQQDMIASPLIENGSLSPRIETVSVFIDPKTQG